MYKIHLHLYKEIDQIYIFFIYFTCQNTKLDLVILFATLQLKIWLNPKHIYNTFKCPLRDPLCYFMSQLSRYTQNKVISKFSVESDVVFVSYARFTVSYSCICHVEIYDINLINIGNAEIISPKQTNMQKICCTQILCTLV